MNNLHFWEIFALGRFLVLYQRRRLPLLQHLQLLLQSLFLVIHFSPTSFHFKSKKMFVLVTPEFLLCLVRKLTLYCATCNYQRFFDKLEISQNNFVISFRKDFPNKHSYSLPNSKPEKCLNFLSTGNRTLKSSDNL